LYKTSKNYVLKFKLKIIESITQFKKNQPNWVTVEKVMHKTSNICQSCQQPKLQESYAKKCSNYRPSIADPNKVNNYVYRINC